MSLKSVRAEWERRLKHSEIKPELPSCLGWQGQIPAGIIGATITAIGSIVGEESGLVIEYREMGSRAKRRVLLGFSDAGMVSIASVHLGKRL